MEEFLEDLRLDAERAGFDTKVSFAGDPLVTVRPDAFKRCLANLIGNAQSHAKEISIEAVRDRRFLTIHVDDDGPGIPPGRREDVFRPFFRLDDARNQDEGGTGLGLAIASTSPARTAAILPWATARRGGYGQPSGCRCSTFLYLARGGLRSPRLPPRGRTPRRLEGAEKVEDRLLIRRREPHEIRYDRIGFRRRKMLRFP
jgi:hypothetical protein